MNKMKAKLDKLEKIEQKQREEEQSDKILQSSKSCLEPKCNFDTKHCMTRIKINFHDDGSLNLCPNKMILM